MVVVLLMFGRRCMARLVLSRLPVVVVAVTLHGGSSPHQGHSTSPTDITTHPERSLGRCHFAKNVRMHH
jgi:hypothetical protein